MIPRKGGYEAWYGVNAGKGYRVGYAKSDDGLDWLRRDEEAGIFLSDSGWDSEAQSYPYVIDSDLGRFMFYNGNGFGRSGLGPSYLGMRKFLNLEKYQKLMFLMNEHGQATRCF